MTVEPDQEIAGPTDSDTVPLYAAPVKRVARKGQAKEEDEDFFDTEVDK